MVQQKTRREYEAVLRDSLTLRGATGGTLSVVSPDGVLSEHAVGLASVRSGIPVDTKTLFRLESHTKLFTTTVALQLRDLGLLDLDDPVVEHLADPAAAANFGAVTVRHLMSHQNGLPDLPAEAKESLEQPIEAVARSAMTTPLLFAPGTDHSYSTTAFIVLGAVIESASGLSWETAVRAGVLQPLGLDQTCFTAEQALAHRTAVGHRFDEATGQMDVIAETFPLGLTPTAGMFSSTTDLLRLSALYADATGPLSTGRPVISKASAADATRGERAMPASFAPNVSQGLGWQLAEWSGHRLLMHQSFGRGTAGSVLLDRDTGVGYAAAVNSESGESACVDIFEAMLGELFGITVPAHECSGPSGSRTLSRYVGEYTHDVYHRYFVEPTDDGRLALRASDVYQLEEPVQARSPLRQFDDSRFGYHSGYVIFGNFDDDGVPHSLHVRNRLARRDTVTEPRS